MKQNWLSKVKNELSYYQNRSTFWYETQLPTFFVHCICALSHFLNVVSVPLHVGEDSGLVRPHKVFGAKELHGELSNLVFHPQDVVRNIFGQTDFCRPPPTGWDRVSSVQILQLKATSCTGERRVPLPVTGPFDPEDVLYTRPLPGFAVVAEPASLWHLNVQTFPMKSSRTGLAAQQATPCTAGQFVFCCWVLLQLIGPQKF